MDHFSDLLTQSGWAEAQITPRGADMGLRRYYLLEKSGDQKALLMDMSRSGLEASLDMYIRIDRWLAGFGIKVPDIMGVRLDDGLAIVEYLGDQSFGDVYRKGMITPADLYRRATEILFDIRSRVTGNDLRLSPYRETRIRERLKQFCEYYVPAASPHEASEELQISFQSVMEEIEAQLPLPVLGFCHADFHLENMIWRQDASPPYGLIDFQDGFWGPCCYDLLNLLEDARVSVPEQIKTEMKDVFCHGMSAAERESFHAWYVYLSAHFHCRVIGLFIKFSQEKNTKEFLAHIPRLQTYIKGHLRHPQMAPLKHWIEAHQISLEVVSRIRTGC